MSRTLAMAESADRTCPGCGFSLDFEPWQGESPSDALCPSCGIQFGYHDAGRRDPLFYAGWRTRWVAEGRPWWSSRPPPPERSASEPGRRASSDTEHFHGGVHSIDYVWIREVLPWVGFGFLHAVHRESADAALDVLRSHGFEIRTLDGRLLSQKNELHGELKRSLGFPDWCGANWDAVNDCWSEVAWPAHMAIVIGRADEAAQANPKLFGELCSVLSELAMRSREQIELFMTGVGPGFPRATDGAGGTDGSA